MLAAEEKRIENTQELTDFERLVQRVAELPPEEQERITYMTYGFLAAMSPMKKAT